MNMPTRKEILSKRGKLTKVEINSLSNLIVKRLLESKLLQGVSSVFTYFNYNNEVETLQLIHKLLVLGVSVCIPWTKIDEKKIIPVIINKKIIEEYLVSGPYGILQPDTNHIEVESLHFDKVDVCICPGSIFDRNGGRIGYGGGFYDRFLSKEKNNELIKIGLCFGFQLFDKIDQKKHDIKMDYIFTEEEVVKVS